MKKGFAFFISLIFVLSFIFQVHSAAFAKQSTVQKPVRQSQTVNTACFSLDVVFVIDQSDSMSSGTGRIANDPTDQRVYAVRWAIDWLADNAYDICPQAVHRVGIISFGSSASIDLPLTEIAPRNEADYVSIRSVLKQQVEPKIMGQTNPQLAFELAAQMLNDAGPVPSAGPRKRAVIFMTDGEPCVEELGCVAGNNNRMDFLTYADNMSAYVNQEMPFAPTLLQQENCLKAVRAKYQGQEVPPDELNGCLVKYNVAPQDYEKNVYVWTMLLHKGAAYSRLLRDIYVKMSESHGGAVIDLRENKQDIPNTFLDILTNLAGVKATRLNCGNLAVNPYLSEARFVFFKISEDTSVRLIYYDSTGAEHVLENGKSDGGFNVVEHYSEGTNERYVLSTPYPGIWVFESDDCTGIDAYYEEIQFDIGGRSSVKILPPEGDPVSLDKSYSDIQVVKHADKPFYDPQKPYYLEISMVDTAGNVILPVGDAFFQAQLSVTITTPDGQAHPYEMEWLPDKQVYRSSTPLELPVQGDYSIKVSADSVKREYPYAPIDRNATPKDIFTSQRHLFDYSDTFRVVCPGLDLVDRCPWATYTATDGCVVCPIKDFKINVISPGQGQNIGPVHATILKGWQLKVNPFQLAVQISTSDGKPLDGILSDPNQPVKLTISYGGHSQEVAYVRDTADPTKYIATVKNMDAQGTYKLDVQLVSDYSEFYKPTNSSISSSFSRIDGPWNQAQTYLILLYIILVMFALFILYNILIRTNPVRGILTFTHYDGEPIASISLNSSKNWKKIGSKMLNAYPQLDLKRIKARNIGRRKKQKVDPEDVLASIEGFSTDPQSGVRVDFETRNGQKFSENLPPNSPVPYSAYGEDNLFQVEYRPNN
jgi:von Willebrand factor type A domain